MRILILALLISCGKDEHTETKVEKTIREPIFICTTWDKRQAWRRYKYCGMSCLTPFHKDVMRHCFKFPRRLCE